MGTVPFGIIFQKRYKRGQTPIVLFLQTEVEAVVDCVFEIVPFDIFKLRHYAINMK